LNTLFCEIAKIENLTVISWGEKKFLFSPFFGVFIQELLSPLQNQRSSHLLGWQNALAFQGQWAGEEKFQLALGHPALPFLFLLEA
jgi:hypothetical protein